MRVAIVGIGLTPFRPSTPEFSWKELMYDAATRAYADAGLAPRRAPVCGDGIQGLAQGAMQTQSGLFDVVAVESHSKASDLLTYPHIVQHALDPILNKPLRGHPNYLGGLEMEASLRASGLTA